MIKEYLDFIRADINLDGDVLKVYIPDNFKHASDKIFSAEKEILNQYNARKLRVIFKSELDLAEIKQDLAEALPVIITNTITDDMTNKVISGEYMGIDIETTGLDYNKDNIISAGIRFGQDNNIYYIPVAHNNTENMPIEVLIEFLKFCAKHNKFVVYNMAFEKKFLDKLGIEATYEDVMIYNYLAGDYKKLDLKSTVMQRLGKTMVTFDEITEKVNKNKFKKFEDVDINKAAQYCGADVNYTMDLFYLLKDKIDPRLVKLDHDSAKVCIDMERRGILIDYFGELTSLNNFCTTRKNRLEKLIYASVGQEFNINSTKQLADILYDKLGIIPDEKFGYTEKGNLAVGEEAIEALIKSGNNHRILKYIKEYRNMVKILGTYIKRLFLNVNEKTGRFHPYFKYTGTDTGRLSSDAQQFPKSGVGARVRNAIIAPRNFSVVSVDYSQIELRILAHLMEDEDIINLIKNGVDLHIATASKIFNLPVEAISKDGKERATSKTLNFAIVYGRSVANIAEDLNITKTEAEKFVQDYFKSFPKLKTLIDDVLSKTRKLGYSKTLLNRKRYLPDINLSLTNRKNIGKIRRAERQAFNAVIQGTAADLIRQAMPVADKLANVYGGELVLQVHDEVVFYIPDRDLKYFMLDIKKALEFNKIGHIDIKVPIEVDVGFGKNYGSAK